MIIPAIDIKDGAVVRLVQGRRDQKVYSGDPVKTARQWVDQGAQFLHVVDLDGAISGKTANLAVLKKIARAVAVPVEVGGGIRTIAGIEKLLDCGFSRVVLGTKAAEDPVFLKKAFQRFKDKIIVSIDSEAGRVAIRGWQGRSAGISLSRLVATLKEIGFQELIYTDILKDGTLAGPSIQAIKSLLKSGIGVIAAGGISSLEDIRKLSSLRSKGLAGIIIGKALYEGRFTLPQALKI